MMRKLVWFLTILVLAIWSGIAWLVHAAIGIGGNLAARNADAVPLEPEAIEWISWLATVGTGLGEWLVITVWAVVAALILLIGAIVARILRLRGSAQLPRS
jgi:hypothetical protein